MGLKDRVNRLEDEHRPELAKLDEREREKWRERILYEANRMNESREREGREPVFEITDNGDVFCTHDGRPVTELRQTLAEDWYWQELEWGCPLRLVHDEEAEAFYTPEGDLALSRHVVNLQHLFQGLR